MIKILNIKKKHINYKNSKANPPPHVNRLLITVNKLNPVQFKAAPAISNLANNPLPKWKIINRIGHHHIKTPIISINQSSKQKEISLCYHWLFVQLELGGLSEG